MRRLTTTRPFTCVTCQIEIVGEPLFHVGLPFCCAGCLADGPCVCSYDRELAPDPRVRHCLDVADFIATPAPARDRELVGAGRR